MRSFGDGRVLLQLLPKRWTISNTSCRNFVSQEQDANRTPQSKPYVTTTQRVEALVQLRHAELCRSRLFVSVYLDACNAGS